MGKGPAVGELAPDFTLSGVRLLDDNESVEHTEYTLSALRGRPLVLAFYPGDNTPVCTKQLCSYSAGLERFDELDAVVWGISPQGVNSHEGFARKQRLRMPLLADADRTVATAFGVAAPVIGLRRAVFLIGPTGVVRWKHVTLVGATFQPVDELVDQLTAMHSAT